MLEGSNLAEKHNGWSTSAQKDLDTYIEDLHQLIPQPLFLVNSDGMIVRVNRALAELTGYTVEELTGQPVGLLFASKEDAVSLERDTAKIRRVNARRIAILTKEKKEVPADISTSLRNDKAGNILGYLAAVTEVAEDRRAQERIEQAAREWRATLDAIKDMVWISDKYCHLLKVNRAYANVVGMEPKQVIGKTCHTVFAWAKEICARCPHKCTIATKESATQEFYDPQHETHLEISTAPLFNAEGEVIASVCVARDITNRKLAEKQIQALSRLRQYFSPKLAQRLVSDEDVFRVRRKNLTIFFTDIRGFSMLSDETEPEELLNMLNEFFTEMTQIIFQWGGTVGKFIGDCIMGFFGDPDEQPNHAELAVKMALEMQARVKTLNEKSPLWSDHPLSIGIGINSGFVTIGNVGPENHRDYTVIGRHVNLAARLEEEAKPGQVLVSQRTYRMVADMVKAEEVGHISVKGFDKPVLAYNVLGLS